MDSHVVDTLLGLVDHDFFENIPGHQLGLSSGAFQGFVERHGTDGDGGVSENHFSRLDDGFSGGKIHHGIGAAEQRFFEFV